MSRYTGREVGMDTPGTGIHFHTAREEGTGRIGDTEGGVSSARDHHYHSTMVTGDTGVPW